MVIPGLEVDLDSAVPVYRQIAEAIRIAAREGGLKPGHRLPATRDLARDLEVNRNTVVAAYEALAAEGWIRSHTGKGTFLVPRLGPDADVDASSPTAETWFPTFSRTVEGARTGGLESIYRLAISNEGISFVGSYPAPELMPVEAFSRSMAGALAQGGSKILTYGPTAGLPSLRETVALEMQAGGSPVQADDILVTNGAQQALELIFRTLLDPGDSAIVEEPTYTGVLGVLGSIGARPIAVPVDEQGMKPDLLKIALERDRPRVIYVQPNFHNPTTAVMSESRRREILDLAVRHRCPIVEDDWAGDLRFEGKRLASLHALDRGRHVIYVSTFSKKLMPGLRIGWAAAPRPVLKRLVELKRIQDCGTSPLLQKALDLFIREGGLAEHLRRVREAYRARRDRMLAALQQHFPAEVRWGSPEGGLFLWVRVPGDFDGAELFAAARREGVLYSRGDLFYAETPERNELRLTYSAASLSDIDSGVAKLGALVRDRCSGLGKPRQAKQEAVPFF